MRLFAKSMELELYKAKEKKMDRQYMNKISNLGTIKGISYLSELLGEEYLYPKISFYALDYGMLPPESSHVVLLNAKILINNEKITFFNREKELVFEIKDKHEVKYFYGNKMGIMDSLYYIEFSNEDYYIEIYFSY